MSFVTNAPPTVTEYFWVNGLKVVFSYLGVSSIKLLGNYSVPKVAIKCNVLKTLLPFLIVVSIIDLSTAKIFAD